MPGKVKVKILAGRNLPVMDRSSDTTDAYVEVKLGDYTYKTDVFRKSLNPAWNSDWFRFEADDIELQDEPLQIRVMDYDTYSANDAIGKVYIDLNPFLLPQSDSRNKHHSERVNLSKTASGRMMSGWLPIFDTLHGIRGEINIIVKVELFSDLNKFRKSSCGIQFFCGGEIPEGFNIQHLPGFVEELVVNDDPEYKWIDKIRTPRASNEARQLLFMKLSGEVKRKIGLKVLEQGANAVIGYKQYFDLEGESGIVVRGIGTAVTIQKIQHGNVANSLQSPGRVSSPRGSRENSAGTESTGGGSHDERVGHSNSISPSAIFHSNLNQMNMHPTSASILEATQPLWPNREQPAAGQETDSLNEELRPRLASVHGVGLANRPRDKVWTEDKSQGGRDKRTGQANGGDLNDRGGQSRPTPINQLAMAQVSRLSSSAPHTVGPCNGQTPSSSPAGLQGQPGSGAEQVNSHLSVASSTDGGIAMQPPIVPCVSAAISMPAANAHLFSVADIPSGSEPFLQPLIGSDGASPSENSPLLQNCVSDILQTANTPSPAAVVRDCNGQLDSLDTGAAIASVSGPSSYDEKLLSIHKLTISKTSSYGVSGMAGEMSEFPFLTITKFPPGFILNFGGMVSAKSVKLLEDHEERDDADTREGWWAEIRQEVRSHARSFGCNIIIGYQEKTSIWNGVIILSASGTAAICNQSLMQEQPDIACATNTSMNPPTNNQMSNPNSFTGLPANTTASGLMELSGSLPGADATQSVASEAGLSVNTLLAGQNSTTTSMTKSVGCDTRAPQYDCSLWHIPYTESSVPFPIRLIMCRICGKGKVPDFLLTTVEPPSQAEIIGRGALLQARVFKLKKDLKVELNAREVSDALPFLEYEIHRQLVNKLKIKGMNAIFGIQVQLALNDRVMAALVTGTAVFLAALPPPIIPKITSSAGDYTNEKQMLRMQTKLRDSVLANREYYGIDDKGEYEESTGEMEDMSNDMDLSTGNKDTCVLEVDDTEDVDIVDNLLDVLPPKGIQVLSVSTPFGVDPDHRVSHCQLFTQVWRGRATSVPREFSLNAQNLLNTVYFKLRRLVPCLISSLSWDLSFDDENEVQLALSGVAIMLQPPVVPPPSLTAGESQEAASVKVGSQESIIKAISGVDGSQEPTANGESQEAVAAADATESHQNAAVIECQEPVKIPGPPTSASRSTTHQEGKDDQDLLFNIDELSQNTDRIDKEKAESVIDSGKLGGTDGGKKTLRGASLPPYFFATSKDVFGINVTPMPFIPGALVKNYLGNLNFFLIRESSSVRECGGLATFVQGFLGEVMAILRSHVIALGGNAVTSFYLSECSLAHSPHKNQAQILINVGGDCVTAAYVTEPIVVPILS